MKKGLIRETFFWDDWELLYLLFPIPFQDIWIWVSDFKKTSKSQRTVIYKQLNVKIFMHTLEPWEDIDIGLDYWLRLPVLFFLQERQSQRDNPVLAKTYH